MDSDTFSSIVWGIALIGILISFFFAHWRRRRRTKRLLIKELLKQYFQNGIPANEPGQRIREIGIRIALGARPAGILQMVLGQGLLLAVLGIGIGIAGAMALTGLVKSLLFEVPPTDVLTFGGVGLTLLAAAALASYLPARRAAAVDPNVALRAD